MQSKRSSCYTRLLSTHYRLSRAKTRPLTACPTIPESHMSQTSATPPWPVEIRLAKDRRTLNVVFDDGASFELSAELLRVTSPSAEVQGHSNPSARRSAASAMSGFSRSIRLAIMRCASASTTCTTPESIRGHSCMKADAMEDSDFAHIWMILRPRPQSRRTRRSLAVRPGFFVVLILELKQARLRSFR